MYAAKKGMAVGAPPDAMVVKSVCQADHLVSQASNIALRGQSLASTRRTGRMMGSGLSSQQQTTGSTSSIISTKRTEERK